MGLFSFLKNKFGKKDKTVDKYSAGLEKSRKNFASKLDNLSHVITIIQFLIINLISVNIRISCHSDEGLADDVIA